jgi:hypothetical protein
MNSRPSLALLNRSAAALAAVFALSGAVIVSCEGDPIGSTSGDNTAYPDQCSDDVHDLFIVKGPDGKTYPTWHPISTTDPDTNKVCFFGHEHGHDPSQSGLWDGVRDHFAYDENNNGVIDASERAASGIPFGYIAAQLDVYNADRNISAAAGQRTQNHEGYKIAYGNGLVRSKVVNGQTELAGVRCDALIAHHQATHNADAFASNLHQMMYAIDCANESGPTYVPKLIVSGMFAYGNAGEFLAGPIGGSLSDNTLTVVTTGTAVPPNSPATADGDRRIPDSTRVYDKIFVANGATSDFAAGLTERWHSEVKLFKAGNVNEFVFFDPTFDVLRPARYFDPSSSGGALRNSVDLCYSGLDANGQLITDPMQAANITRKVRVPFLCDFALPGGPATVTSQRIAPESTRSPFNGCAREVFVKNQRIHNTGGSTTWYTDPFGREASMLPSRGSIKQFIAATETDTANLTLTDAKIEVNRCAGDHRVHLPN